MTTRCSYACPGGGHQQSKPASMFKALKSLAQKQIRPCPECQTGMQLQLNYAFALGVSHRDAVVLASYLPATLPTWRDEPNDVTFYPFLVIVRRNGERSAWLPYFHVIQNAQTQRTTLKYGQWAPFMGLALFEDLLRQARTAGYLASHAPLEESASAEAPRAKSQGGRDV